MVTASIPSPSCDPRLYAIPLRSAEAPPAPRGLESGRQEPWLPQRGASTRRMSFLFSYHAHLNKKVPAGDRPRRDLSTGEGGRWSSAARGTHCRMQYDESVSSVENQKGPTSIFKRDQGLRKQASTRAPGTGRNRGTPASYGPETGH